jgi:hypothetical protein
MMKWRQRAIELAEAFPGLLRDASEPLTDLPKIFKSIDEEAPAILLPYENAALTYNPLRLEDLYSVFMSRLDFRLQGTRSSTAT